MPEYSDPTEFDRDVDPQEADIRLLRARKVNELTPAFEKVCRRVLGDPDEWTQLEKPEIERTVDKVVRALMENCGTPVAIDFLNGTGFTDSRANSSVVLVPSFVNESDLPVVPLGLMNPRSGKDSDLFYGVEMPRKGVTAVVTGEGRMRRHRPFHILMDTEAFIHSWTAALACNHLFDEKRGEMPFVPRMPFPSLVVGHALSDLLIRVQNSILPAQFAGEEVSDQIFGVTRVEIPKRFMLRIGVARPIDDAEGPVEIGYEERIGTYAVGTTKSGVLATSLIGDVECQQHNWN